MFVGQTGVGRVIQRTCEIMNEHPDADPAEHGAIPLPVIQKYVNFWVSSSTDLYGSEISSNAANYFAAGLKGRAYEEKKYSEHTALGESYLVERPENGALQREEVPLRNALNEVLRTDYLEDNQKGVDYWNRVCEKAGVAFRFTLPHRRFNRKIGIYTGLHFDLAGQRISREQYERLQDQWLPSAADRAFVASLMQSVHAPGRVAGWIAPPAKGINGQELDYEYVRL